MKHLESIVTRTFVLNLDVLITDNILFSSNGISVTLYCYVDHPKYMNNIFTQSSDKLDSSYLLLMHSVLKL